MRSLLRYIVRHYAFLLFLVLEVISVALVVNSNRYAKSRFLNSSNRHVGKIYESANEVSEYFKLKSINKKLSGENAHLKSLILNNTIHTLPDKDTLENVTSQDSVYHLITAKVVNNSTNKPFNYITLNKGAKDGVKIDQGVICSDGIVGVVIDVSPSYALVMSVLNPRWNISSKIKKNNYFGLLTWDNNSYLTANLNEIPYHVNVAKGDTIVTSAYSSIFPEDILIGAIDNFEKIEGENYLSVKVKLSTNFKTLAYVQIVDFFDKEEIKTLERQNTQNE